MFGKIFIAIVIAIASHGLVSAQDIFWSFSPTAAESSSSTFLDTTTGSAYIFSDRPFGFDTLDLNFSTSDSSAIQFTGGEVFNPKFDVIGGLRFDSPTMTINLGGDSGNLFLVRVLANGVNPALSPFDPGFDAGVGPNGAVLLARVDFDLIGSFGAVELEFALGDQGALEFPNTVLDPSFGSAVLTHPLTPILGDVNVDGVVDFFDIAPFISVLSTRAYQVEADINLDGMVNFFDIAPLVGILNDQ